MWLALANGTIANVMQGVNREMSGKFSFLASLGDPCNFHHVNAPGRAEFTMGIHGHVIPITSYGTESMPRCVREAMLKQ